MTRYDVTKDDIPEDAIRPFFPLLSFLYFFCLYYPVLVYFFVYRLLPFSVVHLSLYRKIFSFTVCWSPRVLRLRRADPQASTATPAGLGGQRRSRQARPGEPRQKSAGAACVPIANCHLPKFPTPNRRAGVAAGPFLQSTRTRTRTFPSPTPCSVLCALYSVFRVPCSVSVLRAPISSVAVSCLPWEVMVPHGVQGTVLWERPTGGGEIQNDHAGPSSSIHLARTSVSYDEYMYGVQGTEDGGPLHSKQYLTLLLYITTAPVHVLVHVI